jgi:hypothetical protein
MKNPFSGNGGWAILWRITVMLGITAVLISLML